MNSRLSTSFEDEGPNLKGLHRHGPKFARELKPTSQLRETFAPSVRASLVAFTGCRPVPLSKPHLESSSLWPAAAAFVLAAPPRLPPAAARRAGAIEEPSRITRRCRRRAGYRRGVPARGRSAQESRGRGRRAARVAELITVGKPLPACRAHLVHPCGASRTGGSPLSQTEFVTVPNCSVTGIQRLLAGEPLERRV